MSPGKGRFRPLKGGELRAALQATFYLVCVNAKGLENKALLALLSNLFLVVGEDVTDIFDNFIALVEDSTGRLSFSEGFGRFPIRGRIEMVSLSTVQGVLAEKLLHETAAYRQRGHTSTQAPAFLTERTCVFVLGSRAFLAEHIDLYLEWTGTLRRPLINFLKGICALQEAGQGDTVANTYLVAQIKDESFYVGNFDALVAELKHLATERLIERLANDDESL